MHPFTSRHVSVMSYVSLMFHASLVRPDYALSNSWVRTSSRVALVVISATPRGTRLHLYLEVSLVGTGSHVVDHAATFWSSSLWEDSPSRRITLSDHRGTDESTGSTTGREQAVTAQTKMWRGLMQSDTRTIRGSQRPTSLYHQGLAHGENVHSFDC